MKVKPISRTGASKFVPVRVKMVGKDLFWRIFVTGFARLNDGHDGEDLFAGLS